MISLATMGNSKKKGKNQTAQTNLPMGHGQVIIKIKEPRPYLISPFRLHSRTSILVVPTPLVRSVLPPVPLLPPLLVFSIAGRTRLPHGGSGTGAPAPHTQKFWPAALALMAVQARGGNGAGTPANERRGGGAGAPVV